MDNLEKAKETIRQFHDFAQCGIFNTRNSVGDEMETIYDDGQISIDICFGYMYFEVFGLTEEEFDKLEAYYEKLCRVKRRAR